MRQVLVIACGVFIGLSALLIIRGIPGWIDQQEEARAMNILSTLTIEDVIARCGTPRSDVRSIVYEGRTLDRTVSYQGLYTREMELHFMEANEGRFLLFGIDDKYGNLKDASARDKLLWLECLKPKIH